MTPSKLRLNNVAAIVESITKFHSMVPTTPIVFSAFIFWTVIIVDTFSLHSLQNESEILDPIVEVSENESDREKWKP